MRALLFMFLVIAILTPGLLLGLLASPWFYLILFLLLLLFPMVLAPKPENRDSLRSSSDQESPELLIWILVIAAIVFAVPILLLGFLLAPGFFLIILLVTAPLIWMAFRPSS